MQRYIMKRLGQAAVTIVLISVVIFILARLSGNPLDLLLPPEATREDREAMSNALGLNKPIITQYGIFAKNAVRGNFGESIKWDEPAWNLVWSRFPNTLQLAALAMLMKILIALPLGMYSAMRPGGFLDSFAKTFAMLGQSVPTFWTGIMLILLFSVSWHLLPTSGKGPGLGELQGWKHLIMPAFTLGWFGMAATVRLSRSAMLDVLDSEYIKMVRIKGLPERTVVWKHALKNASI
ncbi:MAG: ABC transporter permease, partial [Chloroflexi bacterium]|nr:ABC transporter permease [Chloroflexota bacterium]